MSRGRLIKGGAWLSAGNSLSAIFSFLRNIVIARLVSVEDFGIVVLLSLIVAAVETISNLAIDRLLVQAPEGDDPQLQATAHMLQVARGIIGGLLVFFTATLLAALFKVPQAGWAFQTLALVPLIRSLAHLDTIRIQREMVFQPTFWGIAVPSALSFGLAVPLAYWLRDYSVIVWAMLLQVLAQTAISHLLASRPYRWAWDLAVTKRILSFGWPLLANGLLMFVIFQGDKAIVAVAFTPEVVGWYGAAFMLSMAPAMMVTSVMQSLLLPLLSRAQNLPSEFARRYEQTVQASLGAGLFLAALIAVLGPELLIALFGEPYKAGTEVVILLGLAQGVRVAKGGQFVCSVALAHTKDPLIGNLGRGTAFFAAIIFVVIGFGPIAVATAGTLGEVVSYLIAARLLVSRGYPTASWHFPQVVVFLILVVASFELGVSLRETFSLMTHVALASIWMIAVMVLYGTASPALRSLFGQFMKNKIRG